MMLFFSVCMCVCVCACMHVYVCVCVCVCVCNTNNNTAHVQASTGVEKHFVQENTAMWMVIILAHEWVIFHFLGIKKPHKTMGELLFKEEMTQFQLIFNQTVATSVNGSNVEVSTRRSLPNSGECLLKGACQLQ